MSESLERAHILRGMIDSHFHSLEMAREGLDPKAVLASCFESGLATALDVATTPENLSERRHLTGMFPGIFYSAGYYPSETARFAGSKEAAGRMMDTLERELRNERSIAVGEIGLDEYHDYAPVESQLLLLRAQLEVAQRERLPVIIHNRNSDRLTYEALRSAGLEQGGVMHCFSSDYENARRFIDLGFLISFAGNVTFKNAPDLQETARRLPAESLLVETDSPYLAPVPVRGKRNHPGYVGYTYEFVAQLKGMAVEDLVEQVSQNFLQLFRIAD